jgi:hypothetical protein
MLQEDVMQAERVCPVCGQSKALRFFRRWRGKKKSVLHAECNACGEKTLSMMTPAQRALTLEKRPTVSPMLVERLNARDVGLRAQRIAGSQRAIHAGQRKRQWNLALGTPLRDERRWAQRCLDALPRDGDVEVIGWDVFFEYYIDVLSSMLEKFVLRYNRVSAPVRPPIDAVDPVAYTNAATVAELRRLYSRCVPIRGRRMFRDPWFLSWETARGRK